MISNMICSNCDYAGRPTYDYPCSACDMTKESPFCMWELKEKKTNIMKLQYRYVDIGRLKYRIFLYHDGEFIEKNVMCGLMNLKRKLIGLRLKDIVMATRRKKSRMQENCMKAS